MPRLDNDKFYKNAFLKYGMSAKGLNWHNDLYQKKRFEIIFELIKDEIQTSTLIDAGCGFGDFYLFLEKKKRLPKSYIGYDIIDEFVRISEANTGQICYQKDMLKDSLVFADYYIASGSMNILNRFETYLFIKRCLEHSRKGFIFNLLKGNNKSRFFNYFLPKEIKNMAFELHCEVIIQEGYLPNDFTVYLQKNG